MAAAKSSARARVNGNGRRAKHRLDDELDDLGRHLEVCRALVVVCIEALQGQNAEHDAEIALVLKRAVADWLGGQIERAAVLAERFKHARIGA